MLSALSKWCVPLRRLSGFFKRGTELNTELIVCFWETGWRYRRVIHMCVLWRAVDLPAVFIAFRGLFRFYDPWRFFIFKRNQRNNTENEYVVSLWIHSVCMSTQCLYKYTGYEYIMPEYTESVWGHSVCMSTQCTSAQCLYGYTVYEYTVSVWVHGISLYIG